MRDLTRAKRPAVPYLKKSVAIPDSVAEILGYQTTPLTLHIVGKPGVREAKIKTHGIDFLLMYKKSLNDSSIKLYE